MARQSGSILQCLLSLAAYWALVSVALAHEATKTTPADSPAARSEHRLFNSVRLLASDELEGRGVGTAGLERAADYVAEEFAKAGLNTRLFDGTPFQKFSMVTGAELGPKNEVAFVAPQGKPGDAGGKPGTVGKPQELKFGVDFNPLAIGGSGVLDLPLVFVGYGISSKDDKYDDYQGLNVEGKAVIVLRHEPQQDNPHSSFNGTKPSLYAPFNRKLSNAYEHGAAAVVFCTDEHDIEQRVGQRRKRWEQAISELTEAQAKFAKIAEPSLEETESQRKVVDELVKQIRDQGEKMQAEYDPLLGFRNAGSGEMGSRIPVIFCRRAVLDPIVKSALGQDLAALEKAIDEGPKPHSQELKGWRMTGEVSVKRTEAEVKNVVGVLDGAGPLADETVIIGAHYDHLGWGGEGSFLPDKKEVHNGADDNASGVAALIEVARTLAAREKKLPRRIVFIAFTGEERGLLGSAYYCKHPLFPLDKTVAMLNMDMVGRLTDDKLIIQGFDTATEFGKLIDGLNEKYHFVLTKQPGGFGPSDHASFYPHKIPVLHFFTGIHKDYHRPSDDLDKINVAGMRRVTEMVNEAAVEVAELASRPSYLETKPPAMAGGGDRPYFGSIPDFSQTQEGYSLSGVAKDSPAEKGGLKAGDTIIKLGESRIGNLEDFDSALRKYKAGDKVPVVVKRDKQELTLPVSLDPPR
jgi:hypothetical protein